MKIGLPVYALPQLRIATIAYAIHNTSTNFRVLVTYIEATWRTGYWWKTRRHYDVTTGPAAAANWTCCQFYRQTSSICCTQPPPAASSSGQHPHTRLHVNVINTTVHWCESKKQETKLLPITSPNINRFSKFFHC